MSVIVKGMEMPTECGLCDFCNDDGACMAMGGDDLWEFIPDEPYFPNGWKCNDCPLIELPEKHGRLIDADAMKADYGMKNDCSECGEFWKSCQYDRVYAKMDFCGWIDDAQTVLEAEGEE